ncbi:hypothetical protein [Halocatena marina]|uniref:Uncharacterized protein n=1 Tax=Halocatena marina TaxID=2934937 RepID=A0ABD5YUF7_9EURY|nr:hypothetical protein [Halocatena marina]
MRLHYQRANPDVGGESLLLRFEDVVDDRVACLLVNSGRGVSVDELLDESRGEYLAGIIINNAHPEYYCTLGENVREETPIYAAPDTATILAEACSAPLRDIEHPDAILTQLATVDTWTQLVRGVQLHPLPVGHAPGAAGFLLEISEEADAHTLFVADECTIRRAAGYSGIGLDLPVAIDSLVLSGATADPFAPALTETLSIVCERAREDATVLVTADEPTGIHAAYLLGHLGKRLGSPFPITVTGRTATLCEQLGYSIPNVTRLPDAPPEKVLTPGTVAIAEPDAPVQGPAGQLFEALADDPEAAVLRLTRGVATPITAAQCMVQSFPWHNYPDPETLATVVEALAPVQVVLAERPTPEAERLHLPDSFVWSIDDDLVYTLYDGTDWVAPAEIDPDAAQHIRQRATAYHDEPTPSEYELSLPLPVRTGTIDFAAEGLDVEVIQERLLPAESPDGSWRHRAPNDEDVASHDANSAASSATNGRKTSETTSVDASLQALREQIDNIESVVAGQIYQASVVDAGDDVCLFRVQNPPASFEHGQNVSLIIDSAETLQTVDVSEQENGSEPSDTDNSTTDANEIV